MTAFRASTASRSADAERLCRQREEVEPHQLMTGNRGEALGPAVLVDELDLVYVGTRVAVDDGSDVAAVKPIRRPVLCQRNDVVFPDHRLLNITRDQPPIGWSGLST